MAEVRVRSPCNDLTDQEHTGPAASAARERFAGRLTARLPCITFCSIIQAFDLAPKDEA
jgi:hypothetical protein